jgi:hypothetical protein
MAKNNKVLYISIAVITALVIVATIVYYFKVIKGQNQDNKFDELGDDSNQGNQGSQTSSGGGSTKPAITNDTVFSVKSPLMKNDRVQWIQNRFNKYAKARKLKGKTPDWTLLVEDGVYGNKTADAVNKVMGKKSTSWTEFKIRMDYLDQALNNISPNASSPSGAPTFAGTYNNQSFFSGNKYWYWNATLSKWQEFQNLF